MSDACTARCALCTNVFLAEELDHVAVLPGPDVPVCTGCLGELHEVADDRNDRAFRAQVVRGLAQEFGIEDVLMDTQLDALREMPEPWGENDDLMIASFLSQPESRVA